VNIWQPFDLLCFIEDKWAVAWNMHILLIRQLCIKSTA